MNSDILQYVFWILAALPVFALGIFLFSNLTSNIVRRYTEEKKKKAEEEKEAQIRQTFEDSYSRRRSGGK